MNAQSVKTRLLPTSRIRMLQHEIASSTAAPREFDRGKLVGSPLRTVESFHPANLFQNLVSTSETCDFSAAFSPLIFMGSYGKHSGAESFLIGEDASCRMYYTIDNVSSSRRSDAYYLGSPAGLQCMAGHSRLFFLDEVPFEPFRSPAHSSRTSLFLTCASTETESGERHKTEIAIAVERVLRLARDADFEHGVISRFESELSALVITQGDEAVWSFRRRLADPRTGLGREIRRETLLALGRIRDARTQRQRFALFAEYLRDPAPSIRDAAALALLDLEDPHTSDVLTRARNVETHPLVRANLELALAAIR